MLYTSGFQPFSGYEPRNRKIETCAPPERVLKVNIVQISIRIEFHVPPKVCAPQVGNRCPLSTSLYCHILPRPNYGVLDFCVEMGHHLLCEPTIKNVYLT